MDVEEVSLLSWLEPATEINSGDEFQLAGKHYTFIKRLGEGAFGKTFHVVPRGGIDTVFKVFKNQNAKVTTEITTEFERAKKLNLENCAKMQEILFDKDKTVGFSYEYIEGDTLDFLIDKNHGNQISSLTKQNISLAVFKILVELHESRWVHKDIKPANLVVLPDDRGVCLIDFGLLTHSGRGTRMGAGTPDYMAPEAVGLNAADFSLDLYGACASLLELCIGRKTFDGCFTKDAPNSPFVFQGLAANDVAHLDPLTRNLARQLSKGLAYSPLDRPRSASDVIDLLLQADDRVEPEGVEVISSAVIGLLRQRRGSIGVLPPSDEFAERTQVPTRLETVLIPQLLEGRFDAVFLSGNPGDGKTTFLNSLREHLENRGGQVQKGTDSGWVIKRQNLTFHAMLDASESEGSISSDVRITEILKNLESKDNVVLLAINDGRIDSFMRSYSDQFAFATDVQAQLTGLPPKNPRIAVVDLKLRALVRPDNGETNGLALQVLERLTDPTLWTECEKCISREVCPILDNKTRIRREAALAGFEQLLAISHYRREQRATFRDVRSVFAYVITGDRDCEAIHEARRDGRDLRRAENTLFFDLAFAGSGGDHLFESWKSVDPERLPLAQAARRLAYREPGDGRALRRSPVSSFAREAFFGANEDLLGEIDASEYKVYRYFEVFREFVSGEESPDFLKKIMGGLSRILGAAIPREEALSVTMSNPLESWTVQREFPSSHFLLHVNREVGDFVECASDSLTLTYRDQIFMKLELDDIELIFRADDGEILNDVFSMAVIAKFGGFASRLRLRETSSVTLISPTNDTFRAERIGNRIEMVEI